MQHYLYNTPLKKCYRMENKVSWWRKRLGSPKNTYGWQVFNHMIQAVHLDSISSHSTSIPCVFHGWFFS